MKVALLSGGVGGARLARGMSAVLGPDLTVIVNVADDERIHGLHVSPDLDTVIYTLADVEGPDGWGLRNDSFRAMERLAALGVDTTFRIGDADLATNLYRTQGLAAGERLSEITERLRVAAGIDSLVLPVTDDPVRTEVETDAGWLPFQTYFVMRAHRDRVHAVRFVGAPEARPVPRVIEVIAEADLVVIAPSNPPLSVWPILAVPGIHAAVGRAPTAGVSPLFAGRALKGPAADVLGSLGFAPGNQGVADAYRGLLDVLVVDEADAGEAVSGPEILAVDTRIADRSDATRFSKWLLETV